MATSYTYSKSANFGGNLSEKLLQNEIESDPGIAPTCDYINTNADVVDIWFSAALVSGEVTTLNGIIAAHVPYTPAYVTLSSTGSNNTFTTLIGTQTVNRTINLPNVNDTLVSLSATQTLTGKTMASAANTFNLSANDLTSGSIPDARVPASNVTQHVASIDHNSLLNYNVAQHRIINDAGTSTTELWSANKISGDLAGKAATSHVHSAADVTSGTLGVGRGGTGATTFTNGWLMGNGTGAITAVKNNMAASVAPAAGTDDVTLDYAVGSRWFDTTADKEYVCLDATDGAAVWIETTGGGGGLTSLNTLTAGTQTFATGTSGSDFGISSSTSTHTFNLPDASESARGLVTTGSQTFGGTKTFGTISVNAETTIAFVAATNSGGANLTSWVVNVPAGTTRDMLMICQVTFRGNTASTYGVATAPAGWQLLRTTQNTDGSSFWRTMYVFVKWAGTEPANYTWTSVGPASNFVAGGISTYSGVAAFNIINAEASQATASSLVHATPSITTTVANTMLVGYFSYASCATSWTLSGSMTQSFQSNSAAPPLTVGEGCVCGYIIKATAGSTGSYTATASNDADAGLTQLLALTPAINVVITSTQSAFDFGVRNATILNMGNQNAPTNMYNLTSTAGIPTSIPVSVIGAAGQSADLMRVSNSTATVLSGFDSIGQLMIGGSNTNAFRTTFANAPTANRTITIPDITDIVVMLTATQTLTNKSLTNANCFHVDGTDVTKKIGFISSGATTATTLTLASQQTTSQTLSVPNITAADSIVTMGTTQTISGAKLLTNVTGLFGSTTYATGTASQNTTTVTGVGTTWTSAMVGGVVLFANGVQAFITAFGNTTTLTSSVSQTVTSQSYTLYYNGCQQDNTGAIGLTQINLSGLTVSQAVVTDGSKNLISLAYTPLATVSTIVSRDTNANSTFKNALLGYTTTATAAGTTTLTVASTYTQFFTGATTQTIVLPVASTLVLGQSFNIVNKSTGVITVQSSGANVITTMVAGSSTEVKCILTSGTTAASWDSQYFPNYLSTNTASTIVVRDASGNFSAETITATLTGTASAASALTTTGANVVVSGATAPSAGQVLTAASSTTASWQNLSALTWRNTWNSGTTYAINDCVTSGGACWICISSHTNFVPPNATYWNQIVDSFHWKGVWSGVTAYIVNDVVSNSGSSYICILNHTNFVPPNGTYWEVFATSGIGGSTTQVQYNLSGVFAGTAKLIIAADGYAVLGDESGAPLAAPSSGLKIYAQVRAGNSTIGTINPAGVTNELQSALYQHNYIRWMAQGSGTTVFVENFGNSATGTATTRAVASGSLFLSTRRIGYVSSNSSGSSAGTRHALQQFWRGNAAGLGGFLYVARFGLSSASSVTTQRSFVGLIASTAVIPNGDPSANTNILGFGVDSADSTWTFMHNAASTTTKDALTGTFPARDQSVSLFEARIYCKPNDTTIYYSLQVFGGSLFEGSTSTNIPTSSTFLSPIIWTNNGTTVSAVGIDVCMQYVETPY